ncbi:tRNA-uridine aminocarboxypropyltransferase [Desulfosporosinus sp.]|uniref:tRNA-uridine aminocarboxypropyltransferase n=1 Tax=Desulfosporosinus sp. TaxID=157907 RepID=UPI0025BB213D|nr:tRNA-uridine aminocarboxypropyltransferase [Desulfosporosinus sp.]MBC2729030.1 DTW domain-containing protein [Desulfosporosinus sp.]
MANDFKVKQITRLYESCNKCGLPTLTCICNQVSPIATKSKFWILASKREFYRPSSTGRLLELINPASTEIFLWERTSPPIGLLENINSYKGKIFLLFPEDEESSTNRTVDYLNLGSAFILIDGTWKEARKIIRKSEYLKDIPIVSITPDYQTKFILRRGRVEGTLCTLEAAMEILRMVGEIEEQQTCEKYFSMFLKHYQAGVSSHLPKE